MGKKITKIEPVKQKQERRNPIMKRVCAYCRVSTRSTEQKKSFESQVQYYTRFIQENPTWTLVEIYTDEARSGTKIQHRDGFQAMIQECKRGNIDLILTKSITRFARNTIDSIETIRMLKELGVEVYFEKERMSTLSQKSEQLLTILSSIAQGEAESISTNNRWAIKRRFQNGTYIIGTPAYGYQKDENGNLIIQSEEAKIVRRIFDAYLSGKGSYRIAKELQAEGIPTIRAAKNWGESTVKEILKNPVYIGALIYQKTYTTEGVPFQKKKNHGELPRYLISDNHEPILHRKEVESIQNILEYRRQKHCVKDKEVYNRRYVFSSRIVCGECGGTFRRKKIRLRSSGERIQWSCYQHILDLTKCKQKPILEESIQNAFVNMWNKLQEYANDMLLPLLSTLKEVANDQIREKELYQLDVKIQECKQRKYWLQKILTEGNIEMATFIEKRNQLDRELEELYHTYQKWKGQTLLEEEIAQTEWIWNVLNTNPIRLESFDEVLFQKMIKRVIVYPEKLYLELKNGLQLEEIYGKEG